MRKMTSEVLESLVLSNDILSYEYVEISEDGHEPQTRNTERVKLVFPSGHVFTIDTFCSGCLENTSMEFSFSNRDIETK